MATLLDVAVGEIEAAGHQDGHPFAWFNPVTHSWQEFAGTDFDNVRRGNRMTYSWPKGWPQPWAKAGASRKSQVAEENDVIEEAEE